MRKFLEIQEKCNNRIRMNKQQATAGCALVGRPANITSATAANILTNVVQSIVDECEYVIRHIIGTWRIPDIHCAAATTAPAASCIAI